MGVLLLILGFTGSSHAAPAPSGKPAGDMPPYSVTITTITNGVVAGSGDNDIVRVTVIDLATGLPAAGLKVNFTIAGTTLTSTPSTDASGVVDYGLANGVVGSYNIQISTGGVNYPDVIFTYVSGPPDPTNPNNQLIVDVPTAQADGSSVTTIHAHIVNQYGAPVPGANVVFAISGGSASGTATVTYVNGTTDVNGNATINITNTNTGTVNFTATANGLPVTFGSPATVAFVSGPPDFTNPNTQLIADVPTAQADGTSITVVRAHIVDANNIPVAGVTVVFAISGGTASGTAVVTYVNGTTDANGNAVIDITNTKLGTVSFTATGNGTPIPNGSPATVTFIAGAPDPSNPLTQLIADVPTAQADGTSATVVRAHVVDANSLPVAGATVVFAISGGTASGTAVVTYVNGTTDANGDAVIDITNTKLGTVTFTATANSIPITNGSPALVTFVAGAPALNNPATALIVDVPSATADGTSATVVRAHIVDANNNPVAGATIVFTVSGGTASGTAVVTVVGTGTTDANGDVIIDVTNLKAGTVTFTATVNGQNIPNGSPALVTFVAGGPIPGDPAGPPATGTDPGGGGTGGGGTGGGGTGNNPSGGNNFTLLYVSQDHHVADGVDVNKVAAYVTDINKNPVKNASITFSITAGGTATAGAQLVGTVTVQTNDQGIAEIAITSTVPGTVFINGMLNGVFIDGSYQIVTFDNLPDLNNPLTALTVIIYEALADGNGKTQVKAHIVDLDGNVMSGQEVTFSIDSGTATIVTPQPVLTDANGDAYIDITSKTPGYVLITATINGKKIIFGSPARVKFAPINIYVPKVFTPNNDGTNDLLKPILVGISTFHYFSVYNRWGNLIYTTQNPNSGWDGTFKGVAQPVETYLWIAEGIDVNGKTIVAKGMTSLVR